jgi:hypothetical protein
MWEILPDLLHVYASVGNVLDIVPSAEYIYMCVCVCVCIICVCVRV